MGFSGEHSLKTFLCSQQEMQGEIGPLITARLREGQPSAVSASPVSHEFPVEVETELFLVIPDAEDNIRAVSLENYNSCLALWKESEKFDFGALFRMFRLKEGRTTVNNTGQLLLADVMQNFTNSVYTVCSRKAVSECSGVRVE